MIDILNGAGSFDSASLWITDTVYVENSHCVKDNRDGYNDGSIRFEYSSSQPAGLYKISFDVESGSQEYHIISIQLGNQSKDVPNTDGYHDIYISLSASFTVFQINYDTFGDFESSHIIDNLTIELVDKATTQEYLNFKAGTTGLSKQQAINVLANRTGLTTQEAANIYASSTGLSIQGALNKKAETTGLTSQEAAFKLL